MEDQRKDDLLRALKEKAPKLKDGIKNADGSVLLLEANDMALVNSDLVGQAFRKACKEYADTLPDYVWLIETDDDPFILNPLKIGESVYPFD